MPKADIARVQTDKILETMERRIAGVYRQAEKEVQGKLDEYLSAFASKDARKREQVAEEVITEAEYKRWRTGQIAMGKRWNELKDTLAEDYHNANVIARGIVDDNIAGIYAINHNYATFAVEKGALVDTSYTLYDRATVTRLLAKDPEMLPPPGKKVSARIAAGLDKRWNRQQIQSVMTQSIVQGESIPQIAKRLAAEVGDSNYKAAVRNARTMTTGAECAGRVDAYERAQGMGIKVRQTWVASLDSRTRDSHRAIDGETIEVGGVFSNGCRFPGDPAGEPGEVYNCRCTLVAQIAGFERDVSDLGLRPNNKLGDMTYNEWLKEHGASQDILTPEIIADKMRKAYAAEYRRGKRG